jgi:predicted aspartyl protease
METATMGRVVVTAKMENAGDLLLVQQGTLSASQVRSVEVIDALVDTGATFLGIPRRLIAQLGLLRGGTRQARTVTGIVTLQLYQAVRLTIQGRDCSCDVMELADDLRALIGQLPLEALDYVVDPSSQRLIGNPAHGGEHIIDAF